MVHAAGALLIFTPRPSNSLSPALITRQLYFDRVILFTQQKVEVSAQSDHGTAFFKKKSAFMCWCLEI